LSCSEVSFLAEGLSAFVRSGKSVEVKTVAGQTRGAFKIISFVACPAALHGLFVISSHVIARNAFRSSPVMSINAFNTLSVVLKIMNKAVWNLKNFNIVARVSQILKSSRGDIRLDEHEVRITLDTVDPSEIGIERVLHFFTDAASFFSSPSVARLTKIAVEVVS